MPTRTFTMLKSRTTHRFSRKLMISALAAAQTVTAYEDPEANASIEEVLVLGTQDSGAVSVGRNAISSDDQARSIQILSADLVQQIKPVSLQDLLPLSSNVVFSGTSDGRELSFTTRGFDNTPILRDGFRIEMFGAPESELWNLERVEVLKGPDSIIYGESDPGGIINLVTKRPQEEDFTVFSLEIGSNTSFSPRADINKSFGDVAVRVAALYEEDDGWRDQAESNDKWSLAPSLRWQVGDDTVLTYIGEYVSDDIFADFGTVVRSDGKLTGAPNEQVTNSPTDRIEREFFMTGLDLQHSFNSKLTLEARLRQYETDYSYSVLWLPVAYDQATNLVTRAAAVQDQNTEELAAQLNLFGEVDIAGMRNRFTLGVDWRDTDQVGGTLYDPFNPNFLDWGNPDYSTLPPPAEDILDFGDFTTQGKRKGLFFQNHMDVTDQLLLSFGARYDDSDLGDREYDETVFQGGLRYRLSDAVSFYASYSESFGPQFSRDRNNELLEPEKGEGYELGIKGLLFDGRLRYNAAAFDITKSNVAIPDPSAPLASIAAGDWDSRGVEVDVSGQVTESLQLIFSLGYTDTEDNDGNALPNAAEVTSAAFATYTFNAHWDASIGYEYVGERENGSFTVESHTVINAAAGYTTGPWRVQLNVSNLTDERYLDALAFGSNARGNYPGAPLQGVLTINYSH